MGDKKLLFFGDLAPKYLTGTSISSALILSELESCFKILKVEEGDSFQYKNLNYYLKFFNVISKSLKLFYISFIQKISLFYLVFSVSTFGSIKTLICILSVKIASPKTKIITHIHRGDFFDQFYKKKINRLISKYIFKFCHTVIVLSDKQVEEFSKNIPDISIRSLENSLDLEPEYADCVKEKQNRSKFIYISNYFKEKGIIDLLECFTELIAKGYDVELDTYGAYSSSSLKNEIQKYNSDKIRIHETISGDQKHLEIRKSACLLLPSWNEGQPLVILEAMANATPVIATNVGLIPEMLGEDYEFMYSPKNKEDLESKIIAFLSRQNLDEPGESLFKRYQQNYSKSKHRKKVLEIFNVD